MCVGQEAMRRERVQERAARVSRAKASQKAARAMAHNTAGNLEPQLLPSPGATPVTWSAFEC